MDPLSIAASIAGITVAAVQVSCLLKGFIDAASEASATARAVLMEVSGIHVCLQQLQGFLFGKEEAARSRRSLIMIEQVIIIFTDCVSTFSELEQTLESLQTGDRVRVIDRIKWASKETTVSKILARLHCSKSSLNFMLTILTCTSLDWAEASMRNLTTLVEEVLRSNVNMASRMKNFERMHPALAASIPASRDDVAASETNDSRAASRMGYLKFTFEEDLEKSAVYQRAGLKHSTFSKSSTSSNGPSCLSGLSLSNISDISNIGLPISSMELWNHHRFIQGAVKAATTTATPLDAWYNPAAGKSAFIRTAYFNGKYTNQYAQSNFTGHLLYRRFTIAAPNSPPVFTEGAVMPDSPKELERIREETSDRDEAFELEAAGVESQDTPPSSPDIPTIRDAGLWPAVKQQFAHSRPPKDPLPLLPSPTRRPGDTLATLRLRASSPSCSIFCSEEEAIFPTRTWSKPLAKMGDALSWKHSVIRRINAIQYCLDSQR